MKDKKKRIKICGLFLLLVLLPAGCAPEEKTLLLPKAQSTEEASESSDPARDFSVKKIYAYTYKSINVLQKSAFLQGCGENTIRIAAVEEKESGKDTMVCREVDYRYGFYDTVGEYFDLWENWQSLRLDSEDGTEGELTLDNILPSPDGTQFLVYSGSGFWDNRTVRLYTLGGSEPWLLYEGVGEKDYFLKGSFSPDGQWVTFDVAGALTGDKRIVPVYACGKKESAGTDQYLTGNREGYAWRYYSPDEFFYAAGDEALSSFLWSAELYNDSSGRPGLVSFCKEISGGIFMEMQSWEEPETEASAGRLFLLGTNAEENGEGDVQTEKPGSFCTYRAKQLAGYEDMPFLQYRISGEENCIYYMGNVFQLWKSGMNAEEDGESVRIFPEMVWDFQPMESGDLLVLIARSTGYNTAYVNSAEMQETMDKRDGTSYPYRLRNYWDIQSGDLYLYPADGSESRLLYKNVQNYLGMEYDSQSRRILLETYEDDSLSQRRCIILEL